MTPKVGDAVVSEGIKYRVRQVAPHAVHLALSGPSWRRTDVLALADPGRLTFDATAAVWRGPSVAIL